MPEILPSIGVAIAPADFTSEVDQYHRLMQSGEAPSPEQAVVLSRLWNTIEQHGLAADDERLAEFARLYVGQYLGRCVAALNALPTKGLGYYSRSHDLAIGGLPQANSIFKGLGPAKRSKGGVTGLTLDVTYDIPSCTGTCTGLQVVQVVWVTQDLPGLKLGVMDVTSGSTTYGAFCDGAKNSPYCLINGEAPSHPTKPYYYTVAEAAAYISGCTARVLDTPATVAQIQQVYFETALVCIDGAGSGKDRIVKVFKWGWVGKGATYTTSPGSGGKASGLEEYDQPSGAFKDVVKFCYPSYQYV